VIPTCRDHTYSLPHFHPDLSGPNHLPVSRSSLPITLFFAIAVLPLAMGLGYALLYSLGLAGVLGQGFTLGHWAAFAASGELWVSLAYSLLIAGVSIGLAVLGALWLSLRHAQRLQSGTLGYVLYFPLAVPAMVAAFFTFQFLSKGGLLSRVSYQLGLSESLAAFPDLVNDRFAIGIILSHVMLALPFFLLLFLNLYRNARLDELMQLAGSLGASPRRARWRVGAPVLWKQAFPTIVLYTIFVSGSYEIPLLLGRQSPQMVSVLTVRYLKHFRLENIPLAYILALVYALIIVGLLLFFFRKSSSQSS
jgi:putative spermidine/putrescine transport system permease protein